MMDGTAILALAILALIIIVVAFRYRHSIRFCLKGPLSTSLDVQADNRAPVAGHSGGSEGASGTGIISASGERSVATGSADKATIITGDQGSKDS